jgi:hypothetical protein
MPWVSRSALSLPSSDKVCHPRKKPYEELGGDYLDQVDRQGKYCSSQCTGNICPRGIDLTNNSDIIQIAYNARNLLTQADACGILMLAPKVYTAPSYSSAGSNCVCCGVVNCLRYWPVPLSPIRTEDHCYHMFFRAFSEKQASNSISHNNSRFNTERRKGVLLPMDLFRPRTT